MKQERNYQNPVINESPVERVDRTSDTPTMDYSLCLRSGKCFRSLKANTERLRKSFFPQAIQTLNQNST
ncbi:hypothetical protein QTP86_032160 [Hemibagrus guttatus]|nr:hypothetical protein QTP86_032160 [Hemibagrus guttatus]